MYNEHPLDTSPGTAYSEVRCRYNICDWFAGIRKITGRSGVSGSVAAALIAGAYLFPFMRILLPRTDEGTFLTGAARIVHGQVFARDFVEVMGPGSFYWLAAFYKVFGANFFITRVCLFLTWTLTVFLVHRLCAGIKSPYRILPVVLIVVTSFSSIGIGISHHIDSNCTALLAVTCLVAWRNQGTARWLLISGIFVGLTALIHQPKGILLLVAAGAWTLTQEKERKRRVVAPLVLSAGMITVVGIAAGYFAAQGAIGDVLRATLVWPLQHYSTVNNVPYAYGTLTFNWRGVPLATAGSYFIAFFACVLMVPFLYVDVLPLLLTVMVLARHSRQLHPQLVLYLCSGFALWFSELHRKDIVHLVFGSPLLMIAGVQLLSRAETGLSRAVLVLLTASSCALAACNLVVALSAITLPTRVGNVAMLRGGEEFAALNAHIKSGETVFAYPYCPSYYFLTKTNNPTRFSLLQSSYNTPDQVAEVIGVLDSQKVNHVLWDTTFRARTLALVFPAASRLPDDLMPLDTYLRARYVAVYSRNGFQILERLPDASKR